MALGDEQHVVAEPTAPPDVADDAAPHLTADDGLGAVGGGAHADDEHVIVDELPGRTVLLRALVEELLAAGLATGTKTLSMSGVTRP